MVERYPEHIMIKPEGREYFPDYIKSQIELFEAVTGAQRTVHLVTRLSPEQVTLIYPEENIPEAFKRFLAENPTEHFIFHGNEQIYEAAKRMKGKYMTTGVRGTLSRESPRLGIPFEKWHNFVHSADTLNETISICGHLNTELSVCSQCVAKSVCYGVKGSSMPSIDVRP